MPSNKIYLSNEELFGLVKSLTRGERRRFKLFCKSNNSEEAPAGYDTFFDFLSSSITFDEVAMHKKFDHTAVGQPYATTRAYLLKIILHILQGGVEDFHDNILNHVHLARKVMAKGVRSLIPKILAPAEKYCLETDNYDYLIQILQFRREEIIFMYDRDRFAELDTLITQEKGLQIEALQLNEWNHLLNQTYIAEKLEGEDRRILQNKISASHLLQMEDSGLLRKAVFYKLWIQARIEVLSGNTKTRINSLKELIEFLTSHPALLQDSSILYNYLDFIAAFGKYSLTSGSYIEFESCILELDKLAKRNPDIVVRVFERKAKLLLAGAVKSLDFDRGQAAIKYLETELIKYTELVNPRQLTDIMYLQSGFHTYMGDFKRAHPSVQWIREMKFPTPVPHIYFNAWLHFLILHFEIGNFDILPYLITSTKRKFIKHNQLTDFDNMLFSLIRKALTARDQKDLKAIFSRFRKKFEKISGLEESMMRLTYFPLFAWIDSHINGSTLREEMLKGNYSED